MHIAITLFYFLLLFFLPQQTSSVGGLRFHGSEQPIADRTSYNVFDDKPIIFTDQFHIDFRLSFYPETPIGYILRIKNEDSDRIFNLFFDSQGGSIKFNFNEEGKSNLIAAELNAERIPNMKWTDMRITFDLKGDSIVFSVADREYSVTDAGLPSSYRPVILFGKSDYIIDVPSFAIRDLTVGNASVSYTYALKENGGNKVFENDGKANGKVINPEWLINDAYHWKHEATFHSESVAGANYNPVGNFFYYYNKDSLQKYNMISGETTVIHFEEESPVDLVLGTNFIDLESNKLYTYEVYYNYEYEGPTVASLDLENFRWSAESFTQLPTQLHHHGSFYNAETQNYIIFGGFGNMHYSKNFFSYSLDDNEWYTLEGFTGDVISPRYFSSVGYLKNENSVYIFGGMGNESGEQTVGRKYYYDLYKVNLDTKLITKLWNINWEHDNIVPVRGMVILNDSLFYTLGYPEHFTNSFLKLYEFSITDGSYRVLGDSIPIYSDKITTNANLYYDKELNRLFAVVQEFEDDISSDLNIYSLDFPPITDNELFSYSRNVNKHKIIFIILLLFGVSIAGIAIFLFKRRTGDRTEKKTEVPVLPASPDRYTPVTKSNSIYLFGDFTVCDRNGKDITYMFSAKLKQVLCLVLQYSTEDGISSSHLSEVLWSGKAPSRIKNIRGVTINNLRKALKELDGIELIYEKGYFKIIHTPQFYCDYIRCLEIISSSEKLEVLTSELIGIIKRGKFLYLANHPLFDSFKEALEQKLEPVLVVEMEKYYVVKAYQETIDIADAVFNIDPLNEVALNFQIKALQKLNQKKEAKVKYQAFLIEYKNTMGTDYPNPMDV